MANIDLATPPAGTGPTTIQASGIRTSLGLGSLATGSSVLASQISNATSPGIALLTGVDAASQRNSLGLGSLATGSSVLASQISNATSPGIALLTGVDAASQRNSLGLGSLATGSPSGTANATTYLRGDLSWATVAGGPGVTDPIPLVSSFYY